MLSNDYLSGYNEGFRRGQEILRKEVDKTGIVLSLTNIKDPDNELRDKMIEFLQFRREIKKPIKQASEKAFIRKLEKISGGDRKIACDILEESIANGWQGIFPLKKTKEIEAKKAPTKITLTY